MRTGSVQFEELFPLEIVDFIELEKRELVQRYIEQSTLILSNAKSSEMAKKLLDLIRDEFFIGYKDNERRQDQTRVEELMALQNYTFEMTATGSKGVLEIRKNK